MLDTDWTQLNVYRVCKLRGVVVIQFHWVTSASYLCIEVHLKPKDFIKQKTEVLSLSGKRVVLASFDKVRLMKSQQKPGTLSHSIVFFMTFFSKLVLLEPTIFSILQHRSCPKKQGINMEKIVYQGSNLWQTGVCFMWVQAWVQSLLHCRDLYYLFLIYAGNKARAVLCWYLVVMGN